LRWYVQREDGNGKNESGGEERVAVHAAPR